LLARVFVSSSSAINSLTTCPPSVVKQPRRTGLLESPAPNRAGLSILAIFVPLPGIIQNSFRVSRVLVMPRPWVIRKGVNAMKHLTRRFAQTVAAIAIALFWCISAVGATVGTTLGATTLATAINAVTSTPAEAGRRWRRGRRRWGGRRWRGRRYYGGYPYYRPYYGYGYGYPYYRRPGINFWFGF
jgi:hypothetical protein